MATIGIGIIGCGLRLRTIMGLIAGRLSDVKLVAISDPSEAAIAKAKEQFGAGFTVYADYHDLVNDPAVEWVMVGSWNCHHAAQAIAAFSAGKHVFCEKPLATTFEDCVAMKQAWERSGKTFAIGFTLRYSPHYRAIHKMLADGVIGDLVSMEFNETLHISHGSFIHSDWRRFTENAGSHLLEKCSHDIDIANWMVGSLATKVASFGGCTMFTPQNAQRMECERKTNPRWEWMAKYFENWRAHHREGLDPFIAKKNIVDHQVAIITYANGVRATFHTNCAATMHERRVYLCGTLGTIRGDVYTGQLEVSCFDDEGVRHDVSTAVSGGHGGGDEVIADELISMMTGDMQPCATLLDGFTSAITCFAVDDAMRSETVVDVRPYWERAGIEVEARTAK